MKKYILALLITLIGTLSGYAQVVDNGTASDNWYIGGGLGTQLWENSSSWNVFNPWKKQQLHLNAFGGKQFSPYIGTELGVSALFNTGAEKNFIDGHLLSLNGVANLSNIIFGYKGEPRFFELEGIIGLGWYHTYQNGPDYNHTAIRGAIRGNFKLNHKFSLYVMPEYVSTGQINGNTNLRPQHVNVSAGIKWNIFSERGGFPVCKLYDVDEISELNTKIAALRAALAQKPKEIIKPVYKAVLDRVDNNYTVSFNQGDSNVDDLSDIAIAINKTSGPITIVGGTSPEGSETVNKNLALSRAEAVKKALIEAGVDAERISITNDYSKQRRATIIIGE